MKNIFGILFVLFTINTLYSQEYKRANHWYFGDHAGLDFTYGAALPVTGELYSFEGCAAISDTNGNLLMYSNGGGRDISCNPVESNGAIWNKNHDIMDGGVLLGHQGGGWSSHQSSVIIPKPGSSTNYYMFVTPEVEYVSWGMGACNYVPEAIQFAYFEIDMSQNAGLGKVVVFDQWIQHDTCYEGLCAVQHGNGTDYWVFANDYNNALYEYHVSPSGVNLITKDTSLIAGSFCCSPDGTMLATAGKLYDFDNMTGDITNPTDIPDMGAVEFSPDSRFLYSIESSDEIYQYDLGAANIPASKILIGSATGFFGFGNMQIGPDGKIYVTGIFDSPNMHIIHCPNNRGTACSFEEGAFSLVPGTKMQHCLPNFPDQWLDKYDTCNVVNVSFTLESTCAFEPINFVDLTRTANHFKWYFGDGDSIIINGTNGSTTHTYSSTGNYTITLIAWDDLGNDDTMSIVVPIINCNAPDFTYDNKCFGETGGRFILDFPDVIDSIKWDFGDGTYSDLVHPWKDFLAPGTYDVEVIVYTIGRIDTTVKQVTIHPQPNISINTLNITDSCNGEIHLNASGGTTPYTYALKMDHIDSICYDTTYIPGFDTIYSWRYDSVDYNNPFTGLCEGVFPISVTDANGCMYSDSVEITILEELIIEHTDNYCLNDTIDFWYNSPVPPDSVLWDFGDPPSGSSNASRMDTARHSFSAVDTFSVVLLAFNADTITDSDTTSIIINPNPTASISTADVYFSCTGTAAVHPSGGASPYSYEWDISGTPAYTDSISDLCAGVYPVTITDANSCVYSDTAIINELPTIEKRPLTIYNTITPNADGVNDTWIIENIQEFPDNEVQVFNRWGARVFEQKGYGQGKEWDGRSESGNDLPAGTYYYILDLGDGSPVKQGTVTLVR